VRALHIISGDLWAGAEVQAFTLLKALRDRGMDVAAAVFNEGALARRLREAGIEVSVISEREHSPVSLLLKLRRLIAEWKPDVVHTHRFKENVLGSIANALSENAPSLRTVHGSPEHSRKSLRHLPAAAVDRLDLLCGRHLQRLIVAVSDELAEELRRFFPPGRVIVIENGLDVPLALSQARPADFLQAEPDALHIGIVGRLVPVKRHDIFLRMAAALVQRSPATRWRFHVLGSGPLLSSLLEQARSLGTAGVTTFHGHREDIVSCIASLRVLVICSDHEGLPMTLLESLAVGTSIVAHAVGGIPNVLQGLPGVRQVRQHDANTYADAILDLLRDATDHGSELRERVSQRFTAELNAERFCAAYRSLVGRSLP